MLFSATHKLLDELLTAAADFKVREEDLRNALEFLEYNEYELCFDTLVTQIYEYEITIDKAFYDMVCKVAKKLSIEPSNYNYLESLIK